MQATNEISPQGYIEPHTVLVAEDEVILRMTLSDHLRSGGLQVFEAANAEEARKIMYAVGRVDVVVTDVHMATPLEGIELAKWLSQHFPEIPVIVTSGSNSVARGEAWKAAASVTDFVPKPYSESAIERLVHERIKQQDSSSK